MDLLKNNILEIPSSCSTEILQEAFRLRSWELHPDVCLLPDANHRFAELTQCYTDFRNSQIKESKSLIDWDDPDSLSACLHSHIPDRIKAGMIRRIASLDAFGQLDVLLECLKKGSPALVWSATHVLARIECMSAFPLICDRFLSMPRGVKLAMLRFKRTIGGKQAYQLEKLAQLDADTFINGNYQMSTMEKTR